MFYSVLFYAPLVCFVIRTVMFYSVLFYAPLVCFVIRTVMFYSVLFYAPLVCFVIRTVMVYTVLFYAPLVCFVWADCNVLCCFILCSTDFVSLSGLKCFVLWDSMLQWFCSVCLDFNVLCWFILCSTGLFCYQDCNVIYYFVFPWFVLWIQIAMCCAILFYVLLNAFSNWCFIAILPQWLNMLQPNGYGLLLLYYAYKHPTYCCGVRIWNNNGFLCKAW